MEPDMEELLKIEHGFKPFEEEAKNSKHTVHR